MGPAAAALFAGYQPAGKTTTTATMAIASTMAKASSGKSAARAPNGALLWGDATAFSSSTDAMGNGVVSMAGPPPALPFLSFAKPPMPWVNPSEFDASFVDQQQQAKPSAAAMDAVNDFDSAELEELLDFSMPDDLESLEKDKEELINLDDGFDGTEMSILYSFLVDTPEDKSGASAQKLDAESDEGILNLNMLANTPIESLMESLEEDFTDEELKMTPPAGVEMLKTKNGVPEVKSRRLCRAEGCYKRSRSNGLCISHGGGRRCAVEGCEKSSQGGNLCIRHGGGKRCSFEGCEKAAQSNFLCKAHGGGPRCQVEGCDRSSQGGGYCRSHGGGKRCMFDGCVKGTQRGDYCALHGGSRLCEVPGCMRNDRGGGLCATHGGGKRCMVEGCIKPCRRKSLCSAHLRQAEQASK